MRLWSKFEILGSLAFTKVFSWYNDSHRAEMFLLVSREQDGPAEATCLLLRSDVFIRRIQTLDFQNLDACRPNTPRCLSSHVDVACSTILLMVMMMMMSFTLTRAIFGKGSHTDVLLYSWSGLVCREELPFY